MNVSMDLMQTLALSLLHFLWQGAAIAAVAAAVMYVFRKPATRYLVGVSALGFMFLSFCVTFVLLGTASELPAAATAAGAPAAALVSPEGTVVPATTPWVAERAATDSAFDFAWVARGWLAGVFTLALRIAFGLFVLEQLRRRNLMALPEALVTRFRALQARLGITREIRFSQCAEVAVPAVIGFFRPVVLVPLRALTGLSPEQLEALVAHELGHIKRFDVAVNFVQVIAETLFFFHPAVWWLNKRIRADREDCCDDIAIAASGSKVGYAKALATISQWRNVPRFAMAATNGPVAARVARLLGMSPRGDGTRNAGMVTATLVLAGAVVAGAASLSFARPAEAQAGTPVAAPVNTPVQTPVPAAKPARPGLPARPANVANPPNPVNPPSPSYEHHEVVERVDAVEDVEAVDAIEAEEAVEAIEAHDAESPLPPVAPVVAPAAPAAAPVASPAPAPAPASAPAPRVSPQPRVSPAPNMAGNAGSFLEEMSAAGLNDLTVDELVALKSQGVTAAYIRDMRATGLDPSVDQIIAMRVHGITPDYFKQVNSMGFHVDTDELIAFKVHGVSADFVQQVHAMGFDGNADQIVALRVHDVSADYVKSMRELGFKFDIDQIIAMKIHDISPEYVRQMRSDGFKMDTDELVALRVHQVTPAYRKALEGAGLKVDTQQLIHAKVMDITPEFVAKVRSHGFKDIDLDKIVALKNADVF
jgi:beta-lactamase regulating signal transducer with metallopeptidase domain